MTGRPALLLGALLAGLALLAGCGKKGDLSPPPGEAEAFTWPQVYPDPDTVVPPSPAPEAAAEEEEAEAGRAAAPRATRGFRQPDGLPARDPTRTTTTTYGVR